jgi:DNA-directed RNA polymerase subunit RPC12/RpoP
MMSENIKLSCPDCGGQIIDTRNTVQPYDDFDNYAGFRCDGCKRTFTDSEIASMIESPSASHIRK